MSRLQRFLVTRAENGGFMVHEKAARLGEHEQLLSCFTNPADFIAWLTAELVGKPHTAFTPSTAGRLESAVLAKPSPEKQLNARTSTADLDQADRFARIRPARPQEGDRP